MGRKRGPRGRTPARACALLGALVLTAIGYMFLAPQPQIADAGADTAALQATGAELYTKSCVSCHGANLQGVPERGPSLVGVGDAAVYFQVSTGRMPLARSSDHGHRQPPEPQFDPQTEQGRRNLAALGAYVSSHAGGGPSLPPGRGPELVGSDVAGGGDLFRLNCASCHNFTGRGGVLPSGIYPPNLREASPVQAYAAMLSGPSSMPAFSESQLTPGEKRDIIAYILAVRGQNNAPGGYNLGEFGPSTEGLVAFVVGMAALIGIAAYLGARS